MLVIIEEQEILSGGHKMNYEEICARELKNMSNEDYNKYYGLYLQAQRGQMTWQELYENHLKIRDTRKHIRDVIR